MQPLALAYPREDARIEQGRFGSMMPVTPANGFTLICRTKPGCGDRIRAYGVRLEEAIKSTPLANSAASNAINRGDGAALRAIAGCRRAIQSRTEIERSSRRQASPSAKVCHCRRVSPGGRRAASPMFRASVARRR